MKILLTIEDAGAGQTRFTIRFDGRLTAGGCEFSPAAAQSSALRALATLFAEASAAEAIAQN